MTGEDAMPLEISNSSFIESGDIILSEGSRYAPVRIAYTIQVPFMGEFTDMLVDNLEISYGEDNVHVNDKNEVITATVEEYIVGVFSDEEDTWKIFTPQMMYYADTMSEDLQNTIMEQIGAWKMEKMLK